MLIFSPYVIFNKSEKNLYIYNNKLIKYYYIVISLFLILLLTLRHDYVGADTQNYRWIYDYLGGTNIQTALSYIDPSFVMVNKLLAYFHCDFRVLLFVQSLLYICTITHLIKNNSEIPALSYFLFMTFGYYIFATTMRQAIALSLTIIAFEQIKKKKMMLFIMFVILASTFHYSALIFLPAYWFDKFKFNKKTIFLIIALTVFIFALRKHIGLFILGLNKNEYLITETGGYFLLLFYVAFLILGILYKKNFIIHSHNNKMLFYFIAATVALIPLAKINPAFFRITNYYAIFIILYIPNLIASIRDKGTKSIIFICMIALGLFYFYYKIPSYGIRMHPYIFYWDEYPRELIPPGLLPS
jgi:hypothetical protein